MLLFWVGAPWGIVSLYRPAPLSDAVAEALKHDDRTPASRQSLNEVLSVLVADSGVGSFKSHQAPRNFDQEAAQDEKPANGGTDSAERAEDRNLARSTLEIPVAVSEDADSPEYMQVMASHLVLLRTSESSEEAISETVTAMSSQRNAALREQLKNQLLKEFPDLEQALEQTLVERGVTRFSQ